MITYKIGPNRNRYCEIISNKKKILYRLNDIENGSRDTPEQRRQLLLEIIGNNPSVLHSHVIQIAQGISGMAKRTIEKQLARLEEDQILESEKENERQNSSRYWMIKKPEFDFETIAKKEAKSIVKNLERRIKKASRIYPKLSQEGKSLLMADLLQVIHLYHPIIEIIDMETKIKKEKRLFDRLISQTYNILRSEPRNYIDGRPFLRRLLHLHSSIPTWNLEQFLAKN